MSTLIPPKWFVKVNKETANLIGKLVPGRFSEWMLNSAVEIGSDKEQPLTYMSNAWYARHDYVQITLERAINHIMKNRTFKKRVTVEFRGDEVTIDKTVYVKKV